MCTPAGKRFKKKKKKKNILKERERERESGGGYDLNNVLHLFLKKRIACS